MELLECWWMCVDCKGDYWRHSCIEVNNTPVFILFIYVYSFPYRRLQGITFQHTPVCCRHNYTNCICIYIQLTLIRWFYIKIKWHKYSWKSKVLLYVMSESFKTEHLTMIFFVLTIHIMYFGAKCFILSLSFNCFLIMRTFQYCSCSN
jgi:hypothetical protein